jgi:hypothetical protein
VVKVGELSTVELEARNEDRNGSKTCLALVSFVLFCFFFSFLFSSFNLILIYLFLFLFLFQIGILTTIKIRPGLTLN